MTHQNDTDPAKLTYGQWVRARREELGLSRCGLARRSGISNVQIGNIETGRTKDPMPMTREKLSRALGQDGDGGHAEVVDIPQRPQEAPQQDDAELTCVFCKRKLAQVHWIAWLCADRDPAACQQCVDQLNSAFARGDRRNRYDGKPKLRLMPKKAATGQSSA